MLEDYKIPGQTHVTLVSIVCPKIKGHENEQNTLHSLGELKELIRTLGLKYENHYIQTRERPHAATLIGKGKLQEIAENESSSKNHLLVFDVGLTAGQMKNIKKITNLDVVDRYHIILEIFAKHATTKQAKLQIEMARLQYLLPRLTAFWSHLSRQRGGIGVKGGEGEKQLELDRRIIRERIELYQRQLKKISVSHEEQRKQRKKNVLVGALIGYTNAGKSSLMNRLCKEVQLEEDKLFATLDPTYRTLNPQGRPPMVLVDTVGLISNLPASLVSGFKTTLESAQEADLLIQVSDLSDPNLQKHLDTTHELIDDLKIENKPRLYVFTKKDKVEDAIKIKLLKRQFPNSVFLSTFDEEAIKDLRKFLITTFLDMQPCYDLYIPYDQGSAHYTVKAKTNILNTSNHRKGIFYRIKIPASLFKNLHLNQFILGKDTPLDEDEEIFKDILQKAPLRK